MKPSPRSTLRRPPPAETLDHDQIVILLPDPHVLRVIARSVLLAAALLSFPWLRTMLILAGGPMPAAAESTDETDPKWVDSPFTLRMLVADLKREGLLRSELRNLFIGDPGSRVKFLRKNRMDLIVSDYRKMMVEDNSVDFVLAADGLRDSSLGFVDRVLKVGGIVTVRLGSEPCRLPANYRMVYIRRFGSTIVAMKKISHGNADEFKGGLSGRRLLSVAKSKEKQAKKTMYLRDELMGEESLDGHLFEMDYPKEKRGVKSKERQQKKKMYLQAGYDSFDWHLFEMAPKKISHGNADEFKGGLRGRRFLSVMESKEKQGKKTMYLQEELTGDDSFVGHLFEMAPKKISHGNADEFKGGLRGQRLLAVVESKEKQGKKTMYLREELTRDDSFDGHLFEMAPKKISHGNAGEFEGGLRGRRLLSVAKSKEKQQKKTMYLRDELMEDHPLDEQEEMKKKGKFSNVVDEMGLLGVK